VPTATSRSVKATATATDPVSEFFAALAEPVHLATFEHETATLRFDVPRTDAAKDADQEHWHVTVHDGDVTVSRRQIPADAIIRVARPHLEAIVTGRMNAQAALLRGVLTCEGSIAALLMFQRCLPGPPGSTGKVAPLSSQTVMAQRRPQ
jgi:hypothetical protein